MSLQGDAEAARGRQQLRETATRAQSAQIAETPEPLDDFQQLTINATLRRGDTVRVGACVEELCTRPDLGHHALCTARSAVSNLLRLRRALLAQPGCLVSED